MGRMDRPLNTYSYTPCLCCSTRRGKSLPDAFSKTVPIWCACINRAVVKLKRAQAVAAATTTTTTTTTSTTADMTSHNKEEEEEEEAEKEEEVWGEWDAWDCSLFTPERVVAPREHDAIEALLDDWTTALLEAADLSEVAAALTQPLRPWWVTPHTVEDGLELLPEWAGAFLPIVCLQASEVVKDGERGEDGSAYVQGAGDDEESWAEVRAGVSSCDRTLLMEVVLLGCRECHLHSSGVTTRCFVTRLTTRRAQSWRASWWLVLSQPMRAGRWRYLASLWLRTVHFTHVAAGDASLLLRLYRREWSSGRLASLRQTAGGAQHGVLLPLRSQRPCVRFGRTLMP